MDGKSKEKKLSMEETRLSNLAKRFVRQLSVAIKNCRMFGASHPVLKDTIKNTHGLLLNLISGRDSVTFTLVGISLLFENIPLKNIDPKVYSLITDMKNCNISSLTFLSGIKETELGTLLKIISEGIKPIKDAGGLANFLQKENIPNIKTDEVFFKKVTKKEEESRKTENQLEHLLIMNYLLGKTSISENDIASMVSEISIDPKRMGKIISNMASSEKNIAVGIQDQKKKDVAGTLSFIPGQSGVELARSSIEKVATHMKNSSSKNGMDIKHCIGNLILALEPSLRSKVLITDNLKIADTGSDFTKDIVAQFSNGILINLIVSDFVDSKSSIVETRKLIQRLLPTAFKRKKIFPLLEKKLLEKGVPQKTCSSLLEGRFWSEMTVDEKIEKIKSADPLFCVQIGIIDEIFSLVENLITEKKYDKIKIVTDRALDNLKSADRDLKIRLLRDFEKIMTKILVSKNEKIQNSVIERLSLQLSREKNKDVLPSYDKIFANLTAFCVKNKLYRVLPNIIKGIGYEKIKKDTFAAGDLERIVNNMLKQPGTDKYLVKQLVEETGQDGCAVLTKILLSMDSDDFDAYRERHNIAGLLKGKKNEAEKLLIKLLLSEKYEEIKNALEALTEIGGLNSLKAVEKLTESSDENIQKYAKIALKNIRKRLGK